MHALYQSHRHYAVTREFDSSARRTLQTVACLYSALPHRAGQGKCPLTHQLAAVAGKNTEKKIIKKILTYSSRSWVS